MDPILMEAALFSLLVTHDLTLASWVVWLLNTAHQVEALDLASLQAGRDASFTLHDMAVACEFPALAEVFYRRYEQFCGRLVEAQFS